MVVSLLPTSVLADTLAADQEQQTQQEKARRLAVPSGIDGPQQTRLLPERDVPGDELPEIPGFRIGRNLAVHGSDAQIGRIISILEPTLVAVLSIIVGMVLLSVMLPLMGIMSSIG